MIERAPAVFDPTESIWDEWGPLKRVRRQLSSVVYRLPDTGFFGLTPLRTHIHICGYPRSGTTLLLLMMEYALPRARHFGREISAWRAATFERRNHEVVISKCPLDIFRIHRVRNFYKGRRAKFRPIILIRDPRDALTSHHFSTGKERYFQDLDQWKEVTQYVQRYRNDPEVLLLRYEDLVSDPDAIQAKIDAFTGEASERRYADAHKEERKDFDGGPLNGVRPVDRRGIARWRRPQHRQRVEHVLREVPDFPQILIDLGYEHDASWVEQWREESASAPGDAREAAAEAVASMPG
jgi:hypothetical protein